MRIRPRRFDSLKLPVAATALLILLSANDHAHAQAKADDVQMAVEKRLFFVEHESMRWWKSRKCATCHEGQMLVVAANVVKGQGVPVDQGKLDFWTERWVLAGALVNYTDGRLNGLGIPTAPFALLYRDRERDASATRAKMWAEVLRITFTAQGADGSWTPKAAFVDITPRMALALADLKKSKMPLTPEFRREVAERRTRTEQWIKSHEPQRPEKTESLAAWVVYEHQRGDQARAKQLLDELLGRRRADGGWGIKKGDPSHLLVTSVVLLALKESGLPNDNPVVVGTQRYLLSKQSKDGRWRELGRHFHPDQYYTQYDVWTTGYAVAALSLTMPKPPPGAKRLVTTDLKLVAEVEELTRSAAAGYERAGKPTLPATHRKP
jgi:hypothetical protein